MAYTPNNQSTQSRTGPNLAYANFASPLFPLMAVALLTAIPYLYPIVYLPMIKYWDAGPHLLFSALFFTINLGFYVVFHSIFLNQSAVPRPKAEDTVFLNMMWTVSRLMVWFSIAANLLILGLALPHYNGSLFSLRNATIDMGGMAILSQAHVFFLATYVGIGAVQGRRYGKTLLILGLILTARALLLSERLALIEFGIPILVVLNMLQVVRITWGRLVGLVMAVPVLFVVGELFRSFYVKFVSTAGWSNLDLGFVLGWNLERFFSYYIDVTNKFYFILERQFFGYSDYWYRGIQKVLYRFDLAREPSQDRLTVLLDGYGVRNIEMTNPSGLAQLLSDFGWWGIALYLVLVLALLFTYAAARKGSMVIMAFYAFLYLAFADMVRAIYFYETRALIPLTLFLIAVGLIKTWSLAAPEQQRTYPSADLDSLLSPYTRR